MTAKDLKNALLQEAVQGKLVPQIASEGNAKDLLEEIKKEKAKLIKEGKLKKDTTKAGASGCALPEIGEDELPFEIPENWCWCRLGEICKFLSRGKSPKYSQIKKYPVFAQKCNLKEGGISLEQAQFLDPEVLPKWKEEYKILDGDVLVNSTGTGTVMRTRYFIKDYLGEYPFVVPDSHVSVIRTFDNVESKYIYYCCLGFTVQKYWEENLAGSTNQKELYIGVVGNTVIPLPPLAEQKRIVAALEKFMPLVEEYGEKESELRVLNNSIPKQLKNAILQEAVQGKLTEGWRKTQSKLENARDLLEEIKKECHTDSSRLTSSQKKKSLTPITEDEIPFEIPENWCWCRLGEIVNYKMGKTPPRAESEWWGTKEDTPWISIADMVADGHINKTKEFMSKKAIKEVFNNAVSKAGTLIMSFKLTVGRVSILDIDATHNEAIISIYPYIDNDNITRNYLFKLLPLLSQNGDAKDAIKGRTLNSTSLSNMIIPLPPLAEQKKIVEIIEQMLPLCEKLGGWKHG